MKQVLTNMHEAADCIPCCEMTFYVMRVTIIHLIVTIFGHTWVRFHAVGNIDCLMLAHGLLIYSCSGMLRMSLASKDNKELF